MLIDASDQNRARAVVGGQCKAAVLVLDVTDVKVGVLTTHYLGGNQAQGVMFDVVVAGNSLTVTSLDLNVTLEAGETSPTKLYTKSGTWVGFETNEAAWTLVGDLTVVSAGVGNPTNVDFADFELPANSTSAIYVTLMESNNLKYTNGTNVGDVLASNADLTILEGAGKGVLFTQTYSPRNWNGSIHYDGGAPAVVPEPSSMAMFGIGALGLFGYGRRRRQTSVAA